MTFGVRTRRTQRSPILGNNSRSGDQWDIWQAVYSPVGDNGYPKPIWNKLTGEIDSITHKHIDALKEWEKNNPNWYNNESGQEKYNSMVAQITQGVAKTREKIKKLISKQVHLPVTKEKNIKI